MSDDGILQRFLAVRGATEHLASWLTPEDQQLQSMPDCSPTKWHRGHTTWFFETLVLVPGGVAPIRPEWGVLFNSYYEALGARHPRPQRGALSRPRADEVGVYRREVDDAFVAWWGALDAPAQAVVRPLVELGLAHEEQHQELLLTDILHAFAQHPLRPAVRPGLVAPRAGEPLTQLAFHPVEGGVYTIGASSSFAFDNESPRHQVFVAPFALASRPVTLREWRAFADDGGYSTPSLWLAEGWDWVKANGVRTPLYLTYDGGELRQFTVYGEISPDLDAPVSHVSYYEADAIARFLGARLPTEAEWEIAAAPCAVAGNFRESSALVPMPTTGGGVAALFGDVWEWTASAYAQYPGYRPAAGAVGEYNGKFMVSQLVLRGGSCFTPADHMRASYRNFWHPQVRFQVTGLRLAQDAQV